MLLTILAEGLLLGLLLVLFCAAGIRGGAVEMVFLYSIDVQERCLRSGLTTRKRIRRNRALFRGVAIPAYFAFVLGCVYGLNGARGFRAGFLQMLGILSVANLVDRLGIDEYWVGHTKAWEIPGTEDLKPYISGREKAVKWLMGTVGIAALCVLTAWIMALVQGAWTT